jgi:hypothetical protein
MLRSVRGKLRPQPARPAASPAPKVYEPPSKGDTAGGDETLPRPAYDARERRRGRLTLIVWC